MHPFFIHKNFLLITIMPCFDDKMTKFASEMTNRTFHYKVSFVDFSAVAVVAVAALCMFWHRHVAGAAAGFVLMAVAVAMVERITHTAYTFTEDGRLVVFRGRFARKYVVRVTDIISATRRRMPLLRVSYVLIRHGAGHEQAVLPANEEAFLKEITSRQDEMERADSGNRKPSFEQ